MENPKIGKISSSGQKQGRNMKIEKFSQKSGRPGSYALDFESGLFEFLLSDCD